ncbi:MAG: Abi family protein [Desulfobacteraceae bacterium]|nr:MAG: Abi family protein [Desulfobacteraceae bacterium]
MIVPDIERAKRKISQIGYYRLSGFWYPCRKFKVDRNCDNVKHPVTNEQIRDDCFQENVNFNDIISLYLFDKNLRLLMLDAIERIEIQIRSIIAHEIGYHDPLGYLNKDFIKPEKCNSWQDRNGIQRNIWEEWKARHDKQISRSCEDCIVWHKKKSKPLPFWVVVEAWDFGTVSIYFNILQKKYQNRIANRLNINNSKILTSWLKEINTLRNRCAHHTRIWNQEFNHPLPTLDDPYFIDLNLDEIARKRMFGLICVLWFLVKKIGPSSNWIESVAKTLDRKPAIDSCPKTAMGFPNNKGNMLKDLFL